MSAVATGRQAAAPAGGTTDLRRGSRWLAALLMPVGPAAVAVLRFVLPYDTVDDPATVVHQVAVHSGAQSLVLWLGFVATLTLVPGALWVARLTRPRTPRITAAALVLLVPGYLSLGWLAGSDLLLWTGVHQGVDEGTLALLYTASHPTSELAEGLFVLGHVIGTVLLGVALWHSRAVPRWAAAVTAVSQPLHFVAAVIVVSHPLDLVAWGMNAVGFAAAAMAVLRLPDDAWDVPAEPRAG